MNQPACVDIIPTMLACQVWGQYHLSLHNLHRGNLVKNEGCIASVGHFFQLHIFKNTSFYYKQFGIPQKHVLGNVLLTRLQFQ